MIILDDFDNNNIVNIESFSSSAIYNRITLDSSGGEGMYIFACNFGGVSTITMDVHTTSTKIASGNIPANARSIVTYINKKAELIALGVSAKIISNYEWRNTTFEESILITCSSPETLLFKCSPYYLLFSPLDYTYDSVANTVMFVPYKYDPNVLYAGILADEASELKYGTQILSPDITFVGANFSSYKNLVNNYLGFYYEKLDIITLEVDAELQNLLPLEPIQLRLSASNIYKYKFLVSWDQGEDYYYLNAFLISSTKVDHGKYKIKLKEII